jgi:predicted GTPase
MPYGDLRNQAAQRFATFDDLGREHCTIEEREEYEPHVRAGTTVFAGVDSARVLSLAEAEANIIVWDGGNNDFPFFQPSLHVVIADALRPGHELMYHPGEANVRMADALVINKVDVADPSSVEEVRSNLKYLNPGAPITEGMLVVTTDKPDTVRGKRVLIIEDGPTTTHGGRPTGAGYQAARDLECVPVDPREWAIGSIAAAYGEHPHIGPVLPALGYGDEQLHELESVVNSVPCDAVLIASPVDLRNLIEIGRPYARVSYDFQHITGPSLDEMLAPLTGAA